MSWVPRSPPCSEITWRSHRYQNRVIHIYDYYHSCDFLQWTNTKRISKSKGLRAEVCKKLSTSFQDSSPKGDTQHMLNSFSFSNFTGGGFVYQGSSLVTPLKDFIGSWLFTFCLLYTKILASQKKNSSMNHIVCTNKLGRVNHSSVREWWESSWNSSCLVPTNSLPCKQAFLFFLFLKLWWSL